MKYLVRYLWIFLVLLISGCNHHELALSKKYAKLTRAETYRVEDLVRKEWGSNGLAPSYWNGFGEYLVDIEKAVDRVLKERDGNNN
jgi:hypothetical protein